MSEHIRIAVGYDNQSDQEVLTTGYTAVQGLTNNTALTNPPVDPKALQAAADDLSSAIAAQPHGGPAATAAKNNKRAVLVALLRKLAHYVQDNCGGNLEVIRLAGFVPIVANRTSTPLETPSIQSVDFGNSGELVLKVTRIARARCYQVQSSTGVAGSTPEWKDAGLFTDSRSIRITGLTPGTTYSFQVRAVGRSNRHSDWSNPVSRMSA
jgi:hypothetical protein